MNTTQFFLISRGNTYRTINLIDYYYNQYNSKTKTNLDNLSAKKLQKIKLEAYNATIGPLEKYVYVSAYGFIKFIWKRMPGVEKRWHVDDE